MRGSRNFRQGGGGGGGSRSIWQKSSDNVYFFIYYISLILSLFYRRQMVNFKENYQFSRFQRGPTFSRGGGSNLFEGVQLLIPIETHITCDFPGGGGDRTPCLPLWICTWDSKNYQKKNLKMSWILIALACIPVSVEVSQLSQYECFLMKGWQEICI